MNENTAFSKVNPEIMNKLLNLHEALAACGIISMVTVEPDGSSYLTAPLWNGADGSGETLEVFALANNGFAVEHAVMAADCDYEELVEEFPPLGE